MSANPINGNQVLPATQILNSDYVGLPSILRGCRIDQTEGNSCNTYYGVGEDGTPLHITQWKIASDALDSIFPYKMPGVDPYNIVECIKKYVHQLIQLPACESVVTYYSVICSHEEKNLIVSLARSVVNGLPVKMYPNVTNWTVTKVRKIANALLQSLAHLQKYGLSHGNINNSTVFTDDAGNWKVADHSIHTYLNHLANDERYFLEPNIKKDILAVAELIESLDVSSVQASNFVQLCYTAGSLAELTEHSLVRSLNRSFDDFDFMNRLGRGGFGEVFRVKDARIDKEYAMKRIKQTRKSTLNKALKEVKTLAELTHKNIVRYYRSWTETMNESEFKSYNDGPENEAMEVDGSHENINQMKRKREKIYYVMYIQMELCEKDLRKVIESGELFDDMPRIRKLFFGILEGLKFIHSKNRIHRDLKPDNIFLIKDTVKIGDFGLSTSRKSLSMMHCGTTLYMAPEIGKRGVKARADMYSLGIILFEMCVPIRGERKPVLKAIREKESPIERYMTASHPFYEIIKNLLNHDVERRYTATNLLKKFPGYKHELQSTSCAQTLTLK